MITEDFRPSTFHSLKGQVLVKSLLKPIIRNPEKSPRSLIFEGAFGTGKTSTARIMAKYLNCQNKSKVGDPCGECGVCTSSLKNEMFYSEYDSSLVGTVDQIRNLREHIMYQLGNNYRLIVFDEAHLITRQAQNALLKDIEEVPEKVFFIFCTTEIGQIIPTIRSRSLEIRFERLSDDDINASLVEISGKLKVELPDHVARLVVHRASGHMRDAHKMLNQYLLVGEETFMKNYFPTDTIWLYLFASIVTQNGEMFEKTMARIGTVPLVYLKNDYSKYVNHLISAYVFSKLTEQEKKLCDILKSNALKFFKLLLSDFILNSFENDFKLNSAFTVLYGQFGGK